MDSAQWPSIRLRSLRACEWLIPDSADTTVSDTTSCAYDRWVLRRWGKGWREGDQWALTPPRCPGSIVACGTALRQDIEPGSATVNNFQKTFHLQIKDVSEGSGDTSPSALYPPTTPPRSVGGLPVPQGAPEGNPMSTPALMPCSRQSILGSSLSFGVGAEHLGPSQPQQHWWVQTSSAASLLSCHTQALAVSDHFPVEVTLKAR